MATLSDLFIIKTMVICTGARYYLYSNGICITQHYCSSDDFAYFDLFKHPETKAAIGEMSFRDFKRIPIREE